MTHNLVFVLDTHRQPLMPCHPARARELLREGKAAVFRRFPFTIILGYLNSMMDLPIKSRPDTQVKN